jgi:hypothetical protein
MATTLTRISELQEDKEHERDMVEQFKNEDDDED